MRGEPHALSVALSAQLEGMEPLLDALPTALLLLDAESSVLLYANRAAYALAGGAPEVVAAIYAGAAPAVAGGASAVHDTEIEWAAPGGTRTLAVSRDYARLRDRDVCVLTFDDVTFASRSRRRSQLLAAAGLQLSRSLEWSETLAAVAKAAVPAFADWCFVELLQDDGRIERIVIEHRDPAKRPFIEAYDAAYPIDPDAPIGSAAVVRTGEPELVPQLTQEMLEAVAVDAEQLRLLRAVGFRSSICVPLRTGGKVIGDLALVTSTERRAYEPDDVAVAQELADRCALALEDARRYTATRDAEREARRSRDELEAIAGAIPDAVVAQRGDGQVVYANAAALKLLGYPDAASIAAAPIAEVRERFQPARDDGTPLAPTELPGRRVLAGEPAPVVTVRSRGADGAPRWTRVQAMPVAGEDGRPRMAISVIEDLTDVMRAERGQRLLAEAGRRLGETLDPAGTVQSIAALAVPDFADWCTVDLWDGTRLDRVVAAHVDPAKVVHAAELRTRYPPEERDSALLEVARTGRPLLIPELPDAALCAWAKDAEHLGVLRALGLHSALIVPMTVRDTVLGVASFISAEGRRSFDQTDLALAQALALRFGAALENARLYETTAAIADTLQASLLPPHLPELPGTELAAAYRPAGDGHQVGGDFYDVFDTEDGAWWLVVGDVCGKGAEAAAVTALARYTIRAAAVRTRAPSDVLRRLADAMLRQDAGRGRYCTIACMRLDLSQTPARLSVSSGGHPLPTVLRRDGRTETIGVAGTLLGLVGDPELHDVVTELAPGDLVVAFTDGLTEARAPQGLWTEADVRDVLGRARDHAARAVVDQLLAAALDGVRTPRDDVAVLALRLVGR
jgi:serine phosphatase RsbU (regulator of sigma subunit)/PAS domain-containing protein